MYTGGFAGGAIKSIYKWNNNEEKYIRLFNLNKTD